MDLRNKRDRQEEDSESASFDGSIRISAADFSSESAAGEQEGGYTQQQQIQTQKQHQQQQQQQQQQLSTQLSDTTRNVRAKVFQEQPEQQLRRGGRPSGGGKDRHTKVQTSKGLRDRRVRLSVATAIQFYDVQDRLGYDQPSKAVEWLLKKAKSAIDELPPASMTPRRATTFSPPPAAAAAASAYPFLQQRSSSFELKEPEQQQQEDVAHQAAAEQAEAAAAEFSSSPMARLESRVKARERARERAKEKSGGSSPSHFTSASAQRLGSDVENFGPQSSFTSLLQGPQMFYQQQQQQHFHQGPFLHSQQFHGGFAQVSSSSDAAAAAAAAAVSLSQLAALGVLAPPPTSFDPSATLRSSASELESSSYLQSLLARPPLFPFPQSFEQQQPIFPHHFGSSQQQRHVYHPPTVAYTSTPSSSQIIQELDDEIDELKEEPRSSPRSR